MKRNLETVPSTTLVAQKNVPKEGLIFCGFVKTKYVLAMLA